MKYRAVIVGCGRIGVGYQWHDKEYTHMGAYKALKDRVEVVGIADPDPGRLGAAMQEYGIKGGMTAGKTLEITQPDIVSICTQPELEIRETILNYCVAFRVKGIWCEKPFVGRPRQIPTQVNYMRRGDPVHQKIARELRGGRLIVYGKDDLTTRCHFEDLAKWWEATLEYHPETGPCRYYYMTGTNADDLCYSFPNGGVDGGTCFRAMLGNLLDHLDKGEPLWSPPA